jgi:hypothetical protein
MGGETALTASVKAISEVINDRVSERRLMI